MAGDAAQDEEVGQNINDIDRALSLRLI